MKKKYESPLLKVVKIELNECIAISVKQGQSVHKIIDSRNNSRWDTGVIELDEDGNPKFD